MDEPTGRTPALPVIAMSMADAARSLGVSKPTVYALEREGRLRTFAKPISSSHNSRHARLAAPIVPSSRISRAT